MLGNIRTEELSANGDDDGRMSGSNANSMTETILNCNNKNATDTSKLVFGERPAAEVPLVIEEAQATEEAPAIEEAPATEESVAAEELLASLEKPLVIGERSVALKLQAHKKQRSLKDVQIQRLYGVFQLPLVIRSRNNTLPPIGTNLLKLVNLVCKRIRMQGNAFQKHQPLTQEILGESAQQVLGNVAPYINNLPTNHTLSLRPLVVDDVYLHGGAASHVVHSTDPGAWTGDVDVVFHLEFYDYQVDFDRIRSAVQASLVQLMPPYFLDRELLTPAIIDRAYATKMVKVNSLATGNALVQRWSLFGLGNAVDLLFVHRLDRQYEYSVDSFKILLEECLLTRRSAPRYGVPVILCRSLYDDYDAAVDHLKRRLIVTKRPWELHGGGLLKYALLCSRGFRPPDDGTVPDMPSVADAERAMVQNFYANFAPGSTALVEKITKYAHGHCNMMRQQSTFLLFLTRTVCCVADNWSDKQSLEMLMTIKRVRSRLPHDSTDSVENLVEACQQHAITYYGGRKHCSELARLSYPQIPAYPAPPLAYPQIYYSG